MNYYDIIFTLIFVFINRACVKCVACFSPLIPDLRYESERLGVHKKFNNGGK